METSLQPERFCPAAGLKQGTARSSGEHFTSWALRKRIKKALNLHLRKYYCHVLVNIGSEVPEQA